MRRAAVLVAVWLALATPALRAALESSMSAHMLLQLPLLVAIGALLARGARPGPARWRAIADGVLRGGVAGLLFAAFVLTLWMLPRLLDAAVLDARFEIAKFIALPAAGAALALSWPRTPPLLRLLVHVEAIATLLRFGWGYLEAPTRLCAVYLPNEQVRVGQALLVAGAAYALLASWRMLFGTPPWAAPRWASHCCLPAAAQRFRAPAARSRSPALPPRSSPAPRAPKGPADRRAAASRRRSC